MVKFMWFHKFQVNLKPPCFFLQHDSTQLKCVGVLPIFWKRSSWASMFHPYYNFPLNTGEGGHSPKTIRGYSIFEDSYPNLSKTRVLKGVTPPKPWEGIHFWMINIAKLSKTRVLKGVTPLKPWEGSDIWTISWLGIKPWEGMHFRGSDPLRGLFHMFFSMSTLPTHIGGPSVNLKSTRAPQSFSLRSILSHNLCHWYTISNQDKPHWSWDDRILLRVDKSG